MPMYKTVEIGLKPQLNKKQTNKGFLRNRAVDTPNKS